jgi:hypothetical protein
MSARCQKQRKETLPDIQRRYTICGLRRADLRTAGSERRCTVADDAAELGSNLLNQRWIIA